MNLAPGEQVLHPRHGTATVIGRQVLRIKGADVPYIELEVEDPPLRLRIPEDRLDLVGVRKPMSRESVEEVFAVLRSEPVAEASNWSRRFKATEEKMRIGSPLRWAEVVRDLYLRRVRYQLSPGEKQLELKARSLLLGEIAMVLGLSADEVAERVDAEIMSAR